MKTKPNRQSRFSIVPYVAAINVGALALFAADRIIKSVVVASPHASLPAVPGLLELSLFANPHLAFSLPVDMRVAAVIILVIMVLLLVIVSRAWKRADVFLAAAVSLILAGAFSNLTDRWLFGFVVDYVNVPGWTAFNLADGMILAGVLMWAYRVLKKTQ